MGNYSTLEVCKRHLFSTKEEILKDYPSDAVVERVLRVRDMYMYRLSNPEVSDREFINEFKSRYSSMGKNAAHEYMVIVNALLPLIGEKSREFHRWRYNEWITETYQMAKARKDTKTMERAATSYGKMNRVDEIEEKTLPFHMIVVQPFVATSDPSVLGIKPIKDLDDKVKRLIERYSAESDDIQDVDYEEADLLEKDLFAPKEENDNGDFTETAGIF